MADEVKKAPWYTSRTQWLGILAALWAVVEVLPIPEVQTAKAVIIAVAGIIGGSKARDVFGPKQ